MNDLIFALWVLSGAIGGLALHKWSINDFLDGGEIGLVFYLLAGPFVWLVVLFQYLINQGEG